MSPRILAVTLVAALSLPALAQTGTPRVDQRQTNQEARIDQGVQTGKLNDRESARLEKGQAHVQKLEDQAKADGTVTKREKARLHHAQEKQGRHIARQKHDRQKAPASPAPAATN